jgi:phospholipase C
LILQAVRGSRSELAAVPIRSHRHGDRQHYPDRVGARGAWEDWAEHLFDDFRSDVQGGKLPQVSWIVAPAGYTEHSDWTISYGAWYIDQILGILVSNPEVFSKTVLILNYDEADGSFDQLVPPAPL